MTIQTEVRLNKEQVILLLTRFDNAFDSNDILHEKLNFPTYSEKLSTFAYFVVAYYGNFIESKFTNCLGFIAYYKNKEEKYIYIPQFFVHKEGRHQGIGRSMIEMLCSSSSANYNEVRLEVHKANSNAYNFYVRQGFNTKEEHGVHLLMIKNL